jgi:hypothetical protein
MTESQLASRLARLGVVWQVKPQLLERLLGFVDDPTQLLAATGSVHLAAVTPSHLVFVDEMGVSAHRHDAYLGVEVLEGQVVVHMPGGVEYRLRGRPMNAESFARAAMTAKEAYLRDPSARPEVKPAATVPMSLAPVPSVGKDAELTPDELWRLRRHDRRVAVAVLAVVLFLVVLGLLYFGVV